jgi:hypothetical protein
MKCATCGIEHPIDDIELSFRRPDIVAVPSDAERQTRVQENAALSILEGRRFFVRAVLPLSVEIRPRTYNIGIWVEVGREAFERIYALWRDPNPSNEPPTAVTIANAIPTHPDTIALAASLRLTGPTTRPTVLLHCSEQALAMEQSNGITVHRAHEYSTLFAGSD